MPEINKATQGVLREGVHEECLSAWVVSLVLGKII